MHPRQTAAARACRRVEHQIVRIWRTRTSTDEAFSALKRERRNPHRHYPAAECAYA